jgi:hypothetical protein
LDDLGAALLVQIDDVANDWEDRTRGEINRLLRDADAELEELR